MARGRLRIYLGAAPGVGKTFAMLDEANRRRGRGTDVVVGFVETHGRERTAAPLHDLPIVPRRQVDHRGVIREELDVDAVLARRPAVALVDELAHTNAPGSRHEKRWQDVDDLLAAGIDVISTLNIQHLESLNDVVQRITGIDEHETIPDAVVRAADQVEVVDMDPEALRRRMAHGNIYPAERVDAALANWFRVGNLAALRELALLWVADQVDDRLQDYLRAHGIEGTWDTRERVVVAVTGAPSGAHLIRRAARMAQRAKAELVGVHVSSTDGLVTAPNALLDEHRQLLTDLGGVYHEVVGPDVALALMQFARTERATQLVLGATKRSRLTELVKGSVINTVIRAAGEIDVHVISQPPEPEPGQPLMSRPRSHLSVRRRRAGWALAVLGIPALTLSLTRLTDHLNLTSTALLYLLLVAVVAVLGGRAPSITAAAVAAMVVNFFFADPIHTFSIAQRDNLLALVIFLAVAALVSTVVSQAARRSSDVARARAEAEALARVAGVLIGEDDPLLDMVMHLRSTFGLDGVAVLEPAGDRWVIVEASGSAIPESPHDGESLPLVGDAVLVLHGPALSGDDRNMLHVFAAQLSSALERRQLRRAAANASALEEADQLRTAILRAVSHDLRTPLSSIKASVTSLQQDDVTWSDTDRKEFLDTIDEETDRLDELVGNLLDMSRIDSGALVVSLRPVGLEEPIDVEVSERLSPVLADAPLLERAVANLVANAVRFTPAGAVVRIEAGEFQGRVDLRIIDRGPGVPVELRSLVFEPFQRFGDGPASGPGTGVGLGLAVAKGFVEAMHGRVELDDTPGGGMTAVIELPAAPAVPAADHGEDS